MISLLAYSTLLLAQDSGMSIQFVPKSQFNFDRNVAILESPVGQEPQIVLVNDENVTNEVLEAVSKQQDFVRIVEMVRMDVSGSVKAWDFTGKIIKKAVAIEIPKNTLKLESGQVYMVLESPSSTRTPMNAKEKPAIQTNVAGSRGAKSFSVNNRFYTIQKVGVSMFKYANIRFSVQVRTFVGSLSVEPGSTKSINSVGFTVTGIMPDRGNNLQNFEVIQSGFAGMDNFSLLGQFDWDRIEKEIGPVKNRNEVVLGKQVKNGTTPVDLTAIHLDFSSKRPLKYLSSISVIRSASMNGYFQHIATEPNQN